MHTLKLMPTRPMPKLRAPKMQHAPAAPHGGIDQAGRNLVQSSREQRALGFEDIAPGESQPYLPPSSFDNGRH